jgi:hypothetical protein
MAWGAINQGTCFLLNKLSFKGGSRVFSELGVIEMSGAACIYLPAFVIIGLRAESSRHPIINHYALVPLHRSYYLLAAEYAELGPGCIIALCQVQRDQIPKVNTTLGAAI